MMETTNTLICNSLKSNENVKQHGTHENLDTAAVMLVKLGRAKIQFGEEAFGLTTSIEFGRSHLCFEGFSFGTQVSQFPLSAKQFSSFADGIS